MARPVLYLNCDGGEDKNTKTKKSFWGLLPLPPPTPEFLQPFIFFCFLADNNEEWFLPLLLLA